MTRWTKASGPPHRAHVPVEACEARAEEVLSGLLRGPIGDDIRVRCVVEDGSVVARADGSLPSWLPAAVPAWRVAFEARMRTET